ncbi:zinc finger protein 90 [Trichonephila clavipes]|uniref:Zinc finger protein 90 n=1 Tax=Trichonephila clavipes TaxID=2585209 RepID=A0A8X6SW77_TRICX|nr:zinc finger protein 90 [Trichonephila clavipes]
MKIITVNNYEDFSSDFPVSQDILPPLTEKDFNLSGLDSKIRSRLFQLLISHKSAFARSTVELSAAATEHHRISLQHDYPIKCPIYKIPFNLRNEFRRQIASEERSGLSSAQTENPVLSALADRLQEINLRAGLYLSPSNNFLKYSTKSLTQIYPTPYK